MATPYSKRRNLINSIATRNEQNHKRLADAYSTVVASLADAQATIASYKTVTDEIAADVEDNDAIKLQQLETEKLLAETSEIISRATTIRDAIDAVK